ncbi:MAG TPA: hypothetical protein G4N94_06705 [Caldilineae bacterium]|nr:hypothetical protein [Caldilineae bacterium]
MSSFPLATHPHSPPRGGAFQRFGVPYTLYFGEFLGAVLMFIGFMYATRSVTVPRPVPSAQSVSV